MCTSRTRLALLACALPLAAAGSCATRAVDSTKQPASFFRSPPASSRAAPVSRETGARLYSSLCSSCHGHEGRGDTPLAGDLDPVPADFTRCNFKYRSTPSGSLPIDEDLERTLSVGLPGTAMPSFGALLPASALRALALEVRARCDRFADESPDPPLAIAAAPAYTTDAVVRGRAIYARERCASCHGETGHGDGVAARALKDLRGRPVRPRDHTRGIFRSGFGRQDLYRAFSTGLDGTPMPALPPSVPAAERWDLTQYLVSLSAGRGGAARALDSAPRWFEPARTGGLKWR